MLIYMRGLVFGVRARIHIYDKAASCVSSTGTRNRQPHCLAVEVPFITQERAASVITRRR